VDIALEREQTTRQWIHPQLIEANHILSLSALDLEQSIMSELESNPALELADAPFCPRCGACLDGAYCLTCQSHQQAGNVPDLSEYASERYGPAGGADDDDFDPMSLVASDVPLVERILIDLRTMLDAADQPIAEYILNCLDERGYLEVSVDEIAHQLGRPVADIARVLHAVQQAAPAGVAARDVRECLLLQLAYLAQQTDREVPPAVWRIVADHLDDLAAHRYTRIGRRLALTTADVGAAHEFIRSTLNPFPLQSQEARRWKTPVRAPLVAPDIVVYYSDGEFHVEVVESRATRLRLDPLYAKLAAESSATRECCTPAERVHLRHHLSRAKLFLLAINQRHETLKRITLCLLDLQRDFVLHGVRELRPLTRGMVAERVGVHESTVSRATANKFLMLPNREVIPFSTFFVASLSTKDIIKEMIGREQEALTDEAICQRLRSVGVRIARRTVAKYRATLGILPSTYRQHTAARQSA
jgi:RNA polymerase sigma-54 factor